jgi:carbamoyl-phosphate synthase large subunit
MSAGAGAGNNILRALARVEPGLELAGCHADRFALPKSPAGRNYLVPAPGRPDFADRLRHVVREAGIDLVIPATDGEVRAVSAVRQRLGCRVFLPRHGVVVRCQDKYALTRWLRARGVPAPRTQAVRGLGSLGPLVRRLAPASSPMVWCRLRRGSSSLGAMPVRTAGQARAWIRLWHEMRGVAVGDFTLSEYLPGRDFACEALWSGGRLVLTKMVERISYVAGGSHPSGVSSTGAVLKAVFDERVAEICARAVRALDRSATGLYSIDLKEDRAGVPCVTEINAGRPFTGNELFDLVGKHSMIGTCVRLALGAPVEVADPRDAVEEYYSVRDLDTLPGTFHAEDLFTETGAGHATQAGKRQAGPEDRRAAPGAAGSAEVQGLREGVQRPGPQVRRQGRGHGEGDPDLAGRRLTVAGGLDANDVEALRLEVARLAQRHGLQVAGVSVSPASPAPPARRPRRRSRPSR